MLPSVESLEVSDIRDIVAKLTWKLDSDGKNDTDYEDDVYFKLYFWDAANYDDTVQYYHVDSEFQKLIFVTLKYVKEYSLKLEEVQIMFFIQVLVT